MASAGFLLGKEESVCLLPPIIKTDETTKTAATVRILASVKWMEIRGTDVHFHESSPNNHIHILRNSVSYCFGPFVFIQCPLKFPVAHLITCPLPQKTHTCEAFLKACWCQIYFQDSSQVHKSYMLIWVNLWINVSGFKCCLCRPDLHLTRMYTCWYRLKEGVMGQWTSLEQRC